MAPDPLRQLNGGEMSISLYEKGLMFHSRVLWSSVFLFKGQSPVQVKIPGSFVCRCVTVFIFEISAWLLVTSNLVVLDLRCSHFIFCISILEDLWLVLLSNSQWSTHLCVWVVFLIVVTHFISSSVLFCVLCSAPTHTHTCSRTQAMTRSRQDHFLQTPSASWARKSWRTTRNE